MINFEKRYMKSIVKKIGYENKDIKCVGLFSRSRVGTHLGLILDKGKENSLIISITHSTSLFGDSHNNPIEIATVGCDFSSLSFPNISDEVLKKYDESRAILTIVDNRTMEYKNHKLLHKLKYKTGLVNYYEQEKLKEKILLKNKLTHLSNIHNSKDNYILYQTKTKVECIPLSDNKRIISLIGIEMYDNHIKSLHDLSTELGDQKLPIAEILKKKIDDNGISGLNKILEKFK